MPWLDDADQGIWMCPELHLVTYLFIWAFCLNRALLLQIGFDECCARNATSPWTPTSNLAKAASVVPMETPSYEPFSLFSSLHSIPPASARVSTRVGGTGSRYSMERTDVGGYGFILTCTRKTERDTSDWFYESRCLAKCKRKWVNLKKILRQYESMGTNENGGARSAWRSASFTPTPRHVTVLANTLVFTPVHPHAFPPCPPGELDGPACWQSLVIWAWTLGFCLLSGTSEKLLPRPVYNLYTFVYSGIYSNWEQTLVCLFYFFKEKKSQTESIQ